MSWNIGDKVGLRSYTGGVSGPYILRSFTGSDSAEIQCVRTGQRMVVLIEDLSAMPRSR